MITKSQLMIAVVAGVLIALFATGGTIAQKPKAEETTQQSKITTLELTISQDGRSIVDQNGKIVATFVEDMRVQLPGQDVKAGNQADVGAASMKTESAKADSLKLQGCMRCKDECLIYDKDGKCVKTYRSCTWDFDCKP